MLCEVPLNKEQQAFAADHHGLVYKFLNENRLPEDEFYDVIIFGYLRAVYRYFNEPKLQKYSFATISWKSMQGALSNYNRYQTRRKRNMEVLSIHVGLYPDGAPLEDTIPAHDPIMQQLEMDLLLHELAGRVQEQIKFLWRKFKSAVCRRNRTIFKVNLQSVKIQFLHSSGLLIKASVAANEGRNTGNQFVHIKRFCQIIVRPGS